MALSSESYAALLGRAVKVTLKCGVFQGVLQHVNPDRRSLLLRAVKNLETGRSSPGIKVFFAPEIVTVELLDEPDSGKGTTVLSEYVEEFPSFHEKKEEENVEYTVIDSFQEKIGPAVLHLKQQCVVSIAGEGVNLCRYGKLSWLEIASKSRIFLFDIFLLGPQAFKNGLQMLLEDKNILKVMHDCRWISDCLFHQYGVLLCNVFDTQVADALQFSVETGGFLPHRVCTLQECLMQHLKIPSKWAAIMNCRQQMASPTCMELPKELRQLLDIQTLRKERAIRNYKMNKDGLLIRPTPMEFKKRNDPQEDGNYGDDVDHSPTNKVVSHLASFYNRDVLCQEKLEKSKSRGESVEEP
ncbi:exonuclease 3'-5' domain-containing protein 1 [Amazona aestiva]|uniref:Exonuclease 3'-5' domain-containing protein 1 n=1 Tax=Amazona aestiva TaxID=12930 RepID=A0A0Q3MRV9_AMAAE|nr:exonuclease 3'-5' domain-containing protein 1 [Amazona aestiva]